MCLGSESGTPACSVRLPMSNVSRSVNCARMLPAEREKPRSTMRPRLDSDATTLGREAMGAR